MSQQAARSSMSVDALVPSRNVWVGRGIAFLVLVLFCGISLFFKRALTHGLTVDDKELSLGEVWESDRIPWSFTIQNPTKTRVEVLDLISSCNCLSISPRSFDLEPNGNQKISLVFDLTKKKAVDKTHPFKVVVFPKTKTYDLPSGWIFSGIVKTSISTNDAIVELGKLVRTKKETPSKSVPFVLNVPREQVSSIKCLCDSAFAHVELSSIDGQRHAIQIKCNPALPAGVFEDLIAIHVFSNDNSLLSTSIVRVRGIIEDEVRFLPSELVFGERKLKSVSNSKVVLQSRFARPFSVIDIKSPTGIKISTVTPSAQSSKEILFTVALKIARERDQEETVYVLCRDSDGLTVEVPLNLRYFGVP
jgi:hypothetical protein